jgi:hypothetical protein
MSVNPFDRVNLGWEGLFGPRTMFYHLHPSPFRFGNEKANTTMPLRLVEEIQVPVLQVPEGQAEALQARRIEISTVVVIVAGFIWILWKLALVVRASGIRRNKPPCTEGTQQVKKNN